MQSMLDKIKCNICKLENTELETIHSAKRQKAEKDEHGLRDRRTTPRGAAYLPTYTGGSETKEMCCLKKQKFYKFNKYN